MKAETSTTRNEDVSPISGSLSNLAEGTSTPKSRKEPSFEKLNNFARVTPVQLAYISFPSESRYQPVRVVSTRPPPSAAKPARSPSAAALAAERYAGGGGILIMADTRPGEDAEYIEFETQAVAPAAAAVPAAQNPPPTAAGRHIALDESAPEADPPESFEVSPVCFSSETCANEDVCSTLSIMIRRRECRVIHSSDLFNSLAILFLPSCMSFAERPSHVWS